MPIELMLIKAIKALAELAGMFLLGQGFLYLLAGPRRDTNLFYQILQILTRPVIRFTRLITPKVVSDRHIPFAAALLVFWVWLAAFVALLQYCIGNDIAACRA